MRGKKVKQEYKFSYGCPANFIANQLLMIIGRIGEFYLGVTLLCIVLSRVFGGEDSVSLFFQKFIGILISFLPLYSIPTSIALAVIPKKVVLDDEFVRIYRYLIMRYYPTWGFNDKFSYRDIIVCEKYGKKSRIFGRNYLHCPVVFFEREDVVKIVVENDRNDRVYLVPVQNPDDFINEVWKRVQLAKSKENDETSQSAVPTNMFQFDLQRGYMPDCDEIVLGVNGVEFKTDKSTADLINVKSISYNDIQLCKKSDKHSINGFDSDNIVEIQTPSQTYYIPIKNPYDFINELYKKLNTCNQ
ncbi:MAG: hypothetical protein BHW39_01160 [Firmicutes bacterium CAG:552_39_19]|nr:MAG: hypothetical protein BHW39_01160 [Firmicutes bacterium CAG:552_39_19]